MSLCFWCLIYIVLCLGLQIYHMLIFSGDGRVSFHSYLSSSSRMLNTLTFSLVFPWLMKSLFFLSAYILPTFLHKILPSSCLSAHFCYLMLWCMHSFEMLSCLLFLATLFCLHSLAMLFCLHNLVLMLLFTL
jgi:hypothetical protein